MWFLILSATVALLSGLLLLLSPNYLQNLNKKVNASINKMIVPIDDKIYQFRIGAGISLLLAAGMLFFVTYYLTKKYG